jgi:hypothetical protein
MRLWLASSLTAFIASINPGTVSADCGTRGGPGYRGLSGRCVGWADIGRTCENPPTTKCTAENVAADADIAADHGQKPWDAGKDARTKAGRSD